MAGRGAITGSLYASVPAIVGRGRAFVDHHSMANHLEGGLGEDGFHGAVLRGGLQRSRGLAASAIFHRPGREGLPVAIEEAVFHGDAGALAIDGEASAVGSREVDVPPLSGDPRGEVNSRVDIEPRVLPLHDLDLLDGRGGGREVPADALLEPFDPVGPDPVGAGGQGARILPGSLLPLPGEVVVLALGVCEEEVAAGDIGGQRALTPPPASLLRDLLGELEGTLVQEIDQGRTGPGGSAASGGVLDLLQPRPVPWEVRVRRQVARHAGSLEELPRCDDLGRREILALRVRRPLRLLGRERCGQDKEEREDVHGRGAGGVGGRSWGRENPRSRTGWEFPRAPPQATRVWPRASSNRARSTDHPGFLTPPRRYHPRGHLSPRSAGSATPSSNLRSTSPRPRKRTCRSLPSPGGARAHRFGGWGGLQLNHAGLSNGSAAVPTAPWVKRP